jgi:hypothetical protein
MAVSEPITVQVRRVGIKENPSSRLSHVSRIWLARGIAIAADVLQIAVLPWFVEGAFSPFDTALDVLVALLLTWLVGWHVAFLPSIVTEAIPVVDLAPTWTIAIFIATRRSAIKKS